MYSIKNGNYYIIKNNNILRRNFTKSILIVFILLLSACGSSNESNGKDETTEGPQEAIITSLQDETKILETSIKKGQATPSLYDSVIQKLVAVESVLSTNDNPTDKDNILSVLDYVDQIIKTDVQNLSDEALVMRAESLKTLERVQDKLGVAAESRRADALAKEGIIVEGVEDGGTDVGERSGEEKDEAYYTEKAKQELAKMKGDIKFVPVEKTDKVWNTPDGKAPTSSKKTELDAQAQMEAQLKEEQQSK